MIYNAKMWTSVGDYGGQKKKKTQNIQTKTARALHANKTGLDYLFCCPSQNARTVSDSDCQKFWNITKCIWQNRSDFSIKYALFSWTYKHVRLYMHLKAIYSFYWEAKTDHSLFLDGFERKTVLLQTCQLLHHRVLELLQVQQPTCRTAWLFLNLSYNHVDILRLVLHCLWTKQDQNKKLLNANAVFCVLPLIVYSS